MSIDVHSGKCVYKCDTDEHPILIHENSKYRWMHFGDGAVQSAMSIAHPHDIVLPYMAPVLEGIEIFAPQMKRCLILGLGGGGIVRYLNHHFPHLQLTVIELNNRVIDVAKQFFHLPPVSHKFELWQMDAADFLKHCNQTFDVIMSDIYSTNILPKILLEPNYYEHAKNCLTEDGLLTTNLVVKDVEEFQSVISIIRQVFHNRTLSYSLPHYHNFIVFSKQSKSFQHELERLQSKGELEKVQYDMECGFITQNITSKRHQSKSYFEKIFARMSGKE